MLAATNKALIERDCGVLCVYVKKYPSSTESSARRRALVALRATKTPFRADGKITTFNDMTRRFPPSAELYPCYEYMETYDEELCP